MAVPAKVGIAPPYFFCKIVPLVPPSKPMTQAKIEINEIEFEFAIFKRGITTTNRPTMPRPNPAIALAFNGSFRYLAAKRLTSTGCKLAINAVIPAGKPRLTAKKQPPK